ncbi:MAG: OadG family protein [Promethearchaeota archaeon]
MVNKKLKDLIFWAGLGIIGFILGFIRFLPRWLVYEDPTSFNLGFNLGVLGFVFLFVLGFVISVFRWIGYPYLHGSKNRTDLKK